MVNWITAGTGRAGFDELQRLFTQMLEDGRHTFDAAANALLGGTDPETIRSDLFGTDKRINETEQLLRRQIVVHGTVHGASSFPHLLVLMSIAKDAERIGDYAKNIFDLAVLAPDLGDPETHGKLVALKDNISRLLVRARNLYDTEDAEAARAYLCECDDVQDACDALASAGLKLEGINGAGRAVTARFFKRVTSHAANIVTAVVMPLDKLDFFDE